jgi:Tol biopolymer transport system component
MAPEYNSIFVASSADPDSEVKVLDGAFFESVDLSPDGTMLVFIAHDTDNHSQLYTMNLGNQQIVQLTAGQEDPEAPRFSPDGNTIIFDRVDNGAPGVYQLATIPSTGGSETEITSSDLAQLSAYTPVFTPDGSQIVFTGFGATASIYIVNTDGTGLVQLTTGDWSTGIDVYPSVSADGTQITFARLNETAEPCDGQYTCGWDIYQAGIAGELSGPAAIPLTTTHVSSQPRLVNGKIIFISSPDLNGGTSYIFSMDPNGSNSAQLTSAPYLEVFTY